MPQIIMSNVTRQFGKSVPIHALRDVSLVIQPGEFVAIVGPSGGGKSTLLNLIGLLDAPTDGTYSLDGIDTTAANERKTSEMRSDFFSFIFQSFHLLDRRPVIDSVEIALTYRGLDRSTRRNLALDALDAVGLSELAWTTANKLSGGERQRVAVARAVASGAPVVIADEPTGNLDSVNSAAVVALLTKMHQDGKTIVLVTHSPEVASAASRQLEIRDGVVVGSGIEDALDIDVASPLPQKVPLGSPSVLKIRDLLADAAANLGSRLMRSFSLLLAVAVAVGLTVFSVGLSGSANAQVSDTFSASENREVSLLWVPSDVADQSTTSRSSIVSRLQSLNGVDVAGQVTGLDSHQVRLTPSRPSYAAGVFAITADLPEAARLSVDWAEGFGPTLHRGQALLGANLASQLELGPLIGSPTAEIDGRSVQVVGIVTSSGRVPEYMGAILIPDVDASLVGVPTRVDALILSRAGAAQSIAREAPLVVNPARPDSVEVRSPIDPKTLRNAIEDSVRVTLIAFSVIALVASIVGLANSMVLGVLERKQEFGLRRAVGARRRHLAFLVAIESSILGLLGGVVGLALGLAGVLCVTILRSWSPIFDLQIAPLAVLGGVVIGTLGGIIASARAARIEPSEALRL